MAQDGTEHRKLAAIMFTDMVGYSALAQRNEALALELLEEHRRLLRALFPPFHGTEIETAGDAFLVEFASALEATRCAIEIQRTLAARNLSAPAGRRIEVKIGIHVGDVVHRDGKVMGDSVNIAARIEPLAGPNGICISVDVERQIRNTIEASLVKLGPTELKNIQVPMELFRIVLPWERKEAEAPARETSASGRTRRHLIPAGLVLAALVGLGGWLFWRDRSPRPGSPPVTNAAPSMVSLQPGRIQSLAVKPLDDYSGDTNQAYLSDGMTEALCAALGNVGALRVPGRTSVMRYKGGQKSIQEMARELNVDAIVEGSVQRAGNRILITVQLIEAATDDHRWATNYVRDLSDFFSVQGEVARAIAAEVSVRLTPQEETRLAEVRPLNPEAVESYLKGRHSALQWTISGVRDGIGYLEKSIRIEPSFAGAHAALADAYTVASYTLMRTAEAIPKAEAAAKEAVRLDNGLADAHSALATARFHLWDWAGAEQAFQHALELNEKYAMAHDWYGWYFIARGRTNEALAQMRRALQLEPLSIVINPDMAFMLLFARRYDEAKRHSEETLKLDPANFQAYETLGWSCVLQGDYEGGLRAFAEAQRLDDSPPIRSRLAVAYARAGRREEALRRIRELEKERQSTDRYIRADFIACIYAALDMKDEAFTWLNKAYEEKCTGLLWLRLSWEYDPLRSDPRFDALLKDVGLDK